MKKITLHSHDPLHIFRSLAHSHKFLLESFDGGGARSRYSFVGVGKECGLKFPYADFQQGARNLYEEIEKLVTWEKGRKNMFTGGYVGYVGYETMYQYEKIGDQKASLTHMPIAHFMEAKNVFIYDHEQLQWFFTGENERQYTFIENDIPSQSDTIQFEPLTTQREFESWVRIAKKHIEQGDIFQVVLSQIFHSTYDGDRTHLYEQLREKNPSPYMYYLHFPEYEIIGSSPESLVRTEDASFVTNPIAGTRRRGMTKEEDKQLEEELKHDPKELAEHYMLVDLGRNDMNRVCEKNTVVVSRFLEIERYQRVMHLVSEVKGMGNAHPIRALQSCLPAGTVSGAPKIRAMQIIHDLEPFQRGVYGGAVGYIGYDGVMDFALAIRTMIACGNELYLQAGAGVVMDSEPEREYDETMHKSKALREVLQ